MARELMYGSEQVSRETLAHLSDHWQVIAPTPYDFLHGSFLGDITATVSFQNASRKTPKLLEKCPSSPLSIYVCCLDEFCAVNAAWAKLDLIAAYANGKLYLRERSRGAVARLMEDLGISDDHFHQCSQDALPSSLTYESWKIHSVYGMAAARFLRCHPCIDQVVYPAFSEYKQQFSTLIPGGFGSVVGYRILHSSQMYYFQASEHIQEELQQLDRTLRTL